MKSTDMRFSNSPVKMRKEPMSVELVNSRVKKKIKKAYLVLNDQGNVLMKPLHD